MTAEPADTQDSEAPPRPDPTPYLGFFLADELYGVPLDQLREVARLSHLRRVPGAPAGVAGLVNLRGEILCALDARTILASAPREHSETPFVVALRGFKDPIGLVVDSISDIYSVFPDEIGPAPVTWPAERAVCCIGTAAVPAGLMGLLDLNRLIKV
ncbi:MAG: chemotaxis protein CheW [Vicinamibacterales bacterium]|nr:chemotaxis protein CheW [Vicinamibacterales bacterium]